MALRPIQRAAILGTFASGRMVRIYRDSEWNEYRVRLFIDGLLMPGADYHTDDLTDARDTAQHMARWSA